ncbi:MAG: T9SS type A sorting domain-containing protein [Ignavibacteriaceae bacterium]|jgi:hypothetical protein|nr:T9SS type A sorting domain-containing protein [Ignavibacteriaceae bacterium]MCU0413015.1 T9SS type A sorting domain-containing protein [Ignavibacteriaceae bacterium]
MKKLFFFLVLLLFSSNILAQPYPEVTIKDIQYQPNILTTGDLPSFYNGDTVTVTGVVMVAPHKFANPDSGVILIAGAPALYLQDTTDTDWAGILVRHPNSTSTFDILDTGMVVKVTGWVDEFNVTTQLNAINFEASGVLGITDRREPILITIDSLANTGSFEGKLLGERWEGVLVELRNVTAVSETPAPIGTGFFYVYDQNNTKVYVGNQSSYYRNNATRPPTGSTLEYVRGYIQNRSNVGGNQYINIIMPAYPEDVKILTFAPAISNITRNPVEVGYGVPVTVSAEISDQDGTITSAQLFYRKNLGTNNELAMTNTTGNTWQAVIPGQNDSCIVDFFVRAVDNNNNVSIFPADTTKFRYFYLVLNRALTIQDVQYSPFGGGFSGYNSYQVTVRGIVTADTTDIEGNETGTLSGPQVYIQNESGPWSGIKIVGTETLLLNRGDDVTVTGNVRDDFGMTEIFGINSSSNITVNSTGNPVPEAEALSTATIDLLAGGTVQAEQWEGVLIKYENIVVTDENADGDVGPHSPPTNNNFGDILVADASNSNARVALQYGTHDYHNFWAIGQDVTPTYVKEGYTFESITGILWFGFSNYKLFPRKNDDFTGLSDIGDEANLPAEYSLSQNYPNPFNPSTKIEYSLPVEGNVTLKIFNILGQEVRNLINNELMSAGRHTVTFEATSLPSGVYIYRLQTGNYSSNKKMILLR